MGAWIVGIDTGGTFTDLMAFEVESREWRTIKVASTPEEPSTAVMHALDELLSAGIRAEDISMLVHGTTVATNAILEGRGVRAGLLISRGFRAVYEARGWAQPDPLNLIDPFYQKPPLLAPQFLTEEITERIDFAGDVLTPLNEDDVRRAVRHLASQDVTAIAVCFLFSFRNPAHEQRAAEIIQEEAPHVRVSLSSVVLPTIREYPRLSTTVIDAYVGPLMAGYLTRLAERLRHAGVTTPQVFLMQSHGGLMRINIAPRFPNQTLLSGPAAGVVAGIELAQLAGRKNVVTLNMGGTSTDIAVIANGQGDETSEGRIAGQDIGTPMLAVSTLGAGGGTIAWIGKDGLLKVGPGSAGANPGPACYGLGGDLPTVTDANLLLGTLHAESALGGRMRLDGDLAQKAIREHVAAPLGLDVLQAAAGIVKIVTTNMAIDLRLAFQQRGEDPRQFVLAAFGGAGPRHAARLARDLKIATVLVPLYPGLASAIGLVQTTVKHVYVQSSAGLLSDYPVTQFNHHFAELIERAMADVREEGFVADREIQIRRQVDMRYPHQGYQLAVPCPNGPLSEADKPALKTDFDTLHQRIYGASAADEDAELVTFRVIVEIAVPRLELPAIEGGDGDPAQALQGTRPLYNLDTTRFDEAAIYQRAQLRAGDRFDGPAIIEQFDTTTVVLAGQRVEVDGYGNLLIDTGVA